MTDLDQLLFEAKSAAHHCRVDSCRRAGAAAARAWLDRHEANQGAIGAVALTLLALDSATDAVAQVRLGDALHGLVDAVRAERARAVRSRIADQPGRAYWREGADA